MRSGLIQKCGQKITKKRKPKQNEDHSWVTMLFLLPLFSAIDTRAKLLLDQAIQPPVSPPLDTSALDESYQLHLSLQESLQECIKRIDSSDACVDESYICSDVECGQSECDRRRARRKNRRRHVSSSSNESVSVSTKRLFRFEDIVQKRKFELFHACDKCKPL